MAKKRKNEAYFWDNKMICYDRQVNYCYESKREDELSKDDIESGEWNKYRSVSNRYYSENKSTPYLLEGEFEDELILLRCERGRSACNFEFRSKSTGVFFTMGLHSFFHALTKYGMKDRLIKGKFTFKKQGANYSLIAVGYHDEKSTNAKTHHDFNNDWIGGLIDKGLILKNKKEIEHDLFLEDSE